MTLNCLWRTLTRMARNATFQASFWCSLAAGRLKANRPLWFTGKYSGNKIISFYQIMSALSKLIFICRLIPNENIKLLPYRIEGWKENAVDHRVLPLATEFKAYDHWPCVRISQFGYENLSPDLKPFDLHHHFQNTQLRKYLLEECCSSLQQSSRE